MSDKNIKQLRGQVRQVVKELMPEVMKTEVGEVLTKELQKKVGLIYDQVRLTLEKIDQRSKDIQEFIVRQSYLNPNLPEVPSTEKVEEPKQD